MARITGRANPAAGYNPGRVPWVDVTYSRSGSKVTETYKIGSDPGSGSYGTFSGTLSVTVAGSTSKFAVSGNVSGGSGVIKTITNTRTYTPAYTISISLTGSIPGTSAWQSTTLSGSVSVPAGGSAPGKPTSVSASLSGTTHTISFTKGSGATSTQINWSKNGAAWYVGASTTGSSFSTSLITDCWWQFELLSKNAVGSSGKTQHFTLYTKPKTPTKPTLATGKVVNWTLPAAYKHGVQIRRTDNAGTTIAKTYDLGVVTTWTDPVAQKPTTQYSVREWVGPSLGEAKTWSDWSPWSNSAYSISYKAPTSTKFTAQRCEANGTLTELGTYIKITSSGYATSVKDGTTETNKLTRQVRYREIKAVPGSWQTVTTYDNKPPIVWENVTNVMGGGVIADNKAWEVELLLTDSYSPTVTYRVVVPVSKASFSIGRGGTGHGKVWERGAIDVGGDAYISGNLHLSDPNVIVIDGVAYQASGIGSVPSTPEFTGFGYAWCRSVMLAAPYKPPPGWGFVVSPANTSGFTVLQQNSYSLYNGKIPARHIQIGNNTTSATKSFWWQLVATGG